MKTELVTQPLDNAHILNLHMESLAMIPFLALLKITAMLDFVSELQLLAKLPINVMMLDLAMLLLDNALTLKKLMELLAMIMTHALKLMSVFLEFVLEQQLHVEILINATMLELVILQLDNVFILKSQTELHAMTKTCALKQINAFLESVLD